MLDYIKDELVKRGIDLFGAIPLCDCRIIKRYLLEREGISPERGGTVIILTVPYLAPLDIEPNISAYAVGEDYHAFFAGLFAELLPGLRARYPDNKFAGFTDHSPIDERDAAARAGLGTIGRNGMLITEKYSSYVFLGEIVTDAAIDCTAKEILCCEDCGLCASACPYALTGGCLSAINQKKGELTADEKKIIADKGIVWGCDICQQVCPHTKAAKERGSIYTRIPYFLESLTPRLSADLMQEMSDDDFSRRAYSWRGRETVLRNLRIVEGQDK